MIHEKRLVGGWRLFWSSEPGELADEIGENFLIAWHEDTGQEFFLEIDPDENFNPECPHFIGMQWGDWDGDVETLERWIERGSLRVEGANLAPGELLV